MRSLPISIGVVAVMVAITSSSPAMAGEPKKADRPMTKDDIRPALLRVLGNHPMAFTDWAWKNVKELPIKKREDLTGEVYQLGGFICHLDEKTFSYLRGTFRGEFFLDGKSQWTGKITSSTFK